MIADVKLNLFRQIDGLPENLVLEVQAIVNELVAKKKNGKPTKPLSEKERLAIINEAARHLSHKEDFEAYMKEFEDSTQDRPLPFRED